MKTGKNRVFLKKVEIFLFLISEFQNLIRVCDKFMGNNFMPPPDAPKNLPIGC